MLAENKFTMSRKSRFFLNKRQISLLDFRLRAIKSSNFETILKETGTNSIEESTKVLTDYQYHVAPVSVEDVDVASFSPQEIELIKNMIRGLRWELRTIESELEEFQTSGTSTGISYSLEPADIPEVPKDADVTAIMQEITSGLGGVDPLDPITEREKFFADKTAFIQDFKEANKNNNVDAGRGSCAALEILASQVEPGIRA